MEAAVILITGRGETQAEQQDRDNQPARVGGKPCCCYDDITAQSTHPPATTMQQGLVLPTRMFNTNADSHVFSYLQHSYHIIERTPGQTHPMPPEFRFLCSTVCMILCLLIYSTLCIFF